MIYEMEVFSKGSIWSSKELKIRLSTNIFFWILDQFTLHDILSSHAATLRVAAKRKHVSSSNALKIGQLSKSINLSSSKSFKNETQMSQLEIFWQLPSALMRCLATLSTIKKISANFVWFSLTWREVTYELFK